MKSDPYNFLIEIILSMSKYFEFWLEYSGFGHFNQFKALKGTFLECKK